MSAFKELAHRKVELKQDAARLVLEKHFSYIDAKEKFPFTSRLDIQLGDRRNSGSWSVDA